MFLVLRLDKLGLFLLCCFASLQLSAQAEFANQQQIALEFLKTNAEALNLVPSDVSDVRVTNTYKSKHNGVTHVWIQQQYAGIPVFNGLIGLHVDKNGKVWQTGHRFAANLSKSINTDKPSLSVFQALELIKAALNLQTEATPALRKQISEKSWLFEGNTIARSDIKAEAMYQKTEQGTYRLAWVVNVDQKATNDIWFVAIDAQTGSVLNKQNTTVYCSHEKVTSMVDYAPEKIDCGHIHHKNEKVAEDGAGDGAKYRVFALPAESPIHGPHVLLTDPADSTASPYGWHDTNGVPGAEFNYTRGNNVFAYLDDDDNDLPPATPGPIGGPIAAPLTFDFPYDYNQEPESNLDGSLTNLFYMNNMLHDVLYNYGFDEPAANFQTNNYGNGGNGNDAVLAEGLDGGGTDNANFATPGDGGPGRMQMFKWTRAGGNLVTVNAPANIVGTYAASATTWGTPISPTPVTGSAIMVDDGSDIPTLGCSPGSMQDLTGKIVMIDRGICEFGLKALQAEERGAVACIICNFEDALPNMGPGAVGGQVTIPVVGMQKKDCDLLRQFSGTTLNLSLVLPGNNGPEFYDGDVDNGIVAHEYFHGVSNRLTGGGSASCLGNLEQMGEGWSDFGTLILTAEEGDKGTDRRGIGTFTQRETVTGQGIRRFPYSTDMSVNPLTYGNVAENTETHAVGEVWTAVTWDLYWAMVEKYGFDKNLKNKNSGNARAIQLVMDGMKMQPCNPGFIDGRDAIRMADILNYGGVDTCLIETVFARRGMGRLALQGGSNSAGDQVQNFEPLAVCIQELKLKKTITETIQPGGEATVNLEVINHKQGPATGVKLTDNFGAGMSVVPGSITGGGTVSGNTVVWNIGSMAFGDVKTFTYKLKNDPSSRSLLLYADPMDNDANWLSLGDAIFFSPQSTDVKSGTGAFFANGPATKDDAELEQVEGFTVTGTRPTLRFWQKYNLQAGTDGGWVEISLNNGGNWQRISANRTIRNGYPGRLAYNTIAIPFLDGFSGNSNGWIQSYFDFSAFKGQYVLLRYRMATNETTASNGWYLDQTELLDLVNHQDAAVITSLEGDNITVKAPNAGVIVDTDGTIGTESIPNELDIAVYPNPANDVLMVAFGKSLAGNTLTRIIAADGRTMQTRTFAGVQQGQVAQFDVMPLQSGVYILQIVNGNEVSTHKVVKH
jgi:extracellular elastinolytic metalloproteinase